MNKHYLITGASSGIGFATAKMMIAQGNQVTGVARDFSETPNLGELFMPVTLDLSDVDQLPSQLKQSDQLNYVFDGIILNAGLGQFGGLEQFSYTQIQTLLNTNLTSQLFLLRYYLPTLKQHEQTTDIILIGSEAALQGAKYGVVYCASKFAIRGIAQSLRHECAQSNTRVTLINPGAVRTDFFDELYFEPEQGEQHAIAAESIAKSIMHAISLPEGTVIEEINVQPIKKVLRKK